MFPEMAIGMDSKPESLINGRYRVIRPLGEGGFAQVYEAEDLDLGRRVAIKILKDARVTSDENLLRFRREAMVLAKLVHPNIISVYSFDLLEDATPCIVMELLSGDSLQKLLSRDKKLESALAIRIFAQVCEGLSYAHSLGVVHRDLSPQNIFLIGGEPSGTVKIIDFGLSRIIEDTTVQLTKTGLLIGNPPYMSPELAAGQKVDLRSDIYSLGCVIYESLCGRPPFESDSPVGLLFMHQNEYPREPDFIMDEADKELQLKAVLLRCLQKDPAKRYQSCAELRAALLANGKEFYEPKEQLERLKLEPWQGASKEKTVLGRWAFVAFAMCMLLPILFFAFSRMAPKANLTHNNAGAETKAEEARSKKSLSATSSLVRLLRRDPSNDKDLQNGIAELDRLVPEFSSKGNKALLFVLYDRKSQLEQGLGEASEAEKSYKKCLEQCRSLDGGLTVEAMTTYLRLAELYLRRKQYDLAVQSARMSLELNYRFSDGKYQKLELPEFCDWQTIGFSRGRVLAYMVLAKSFHAEGNMAEAEEFATKAAGNLPENWPWLYDVFVERVNILFERKQEKAAVKELHSVAAALDVYINGLQFEATRFDARMAMYSYISLGDCFRKHGYEKEAAKVYRKVVELNTLHNGDVVVTANAKARLATIAEAGI